MLIYHDYKELLIKNVELKNLPFHSVVISPRTEIIRQILTNKYDALFPSRSFGNKTMKFLQFKFGKA